MSRSRLPILVAAGLLCLAAAHAVPAHAQEPPLKILADRMSGARGPQGDMVMLEGNLRITRGRAVITARSGRYLRSEGMLYLDDDVRLVDGTLTVTSRHAAYSEISDVLTLEGDVVLRDREATLRAPSATYDRRTGRAELIGGVDGRDGDRTLVGDAASYWRDSSLVQARGHVRTADVPNRLELDAREIDYRRDTRVAVARGEPVLRARDEDGRVSTLRGRLLKVDTARRIAEAIDSVRVERDTLQGRADYAMFDDSLQVGWMTGNPRVWDDQTVVTGDSIQVLSDQRRLRLVRVLGDPVVDYRGLRPGSVGETSRLTGDRIEMFFSADNIDSLVSLGHARNAYQGAPAPHKTPETNLATGDTITVYFRERKIDRAKVIGEPKGEYHLAVADTDTAAVRRERVEYDAQRIVFEVTRNRIVLERSAHMTYRDLTLRADRVEFDVDRQTVVARGKPTLVDRGDQVEGQLMTYDLESRIGTIYQAQTAYEQGLYRGDQIRKVSDDELHVRHGRYSTCDLPEPHYHFGANAMKIFLKDKLVARPVVFYVKNVPLFALPFWVFPIKPGRHSGLLFPQFEFGLNDAAGQFIRNAGYYWAPNDYMDLQVTGDYYQAEPSWVLRGEGNYKLQYVLDGYMKGSYARNEGIAPRTDWDFYGTHSQELTPRTRLAAQASFISSRSYATSGQYGQSFANRLDRFLTSSLSIGHNADWATITAALDRREDLDADQDLADPDGPGPIPRQPVGATASLAGLTETFPSISVSFPTRAIGSLGFLRGTPLESGLRSMYFGLSSRYLSQFERRAFVADYTPGVDSLSDSTQVIGHHEETRRALQSDMTLRDARRLLGWLNVAPAVTINSVVWDRDVFGRQVVPSAVWRGSVSSSATFYGTFRTGIGTLEGIRHVLTPSVSYSFSPSFPSLTYRDSSGFQQSRFAPFGGISIGGREASFMNFSLNQRLQVKYRKGEQIEKLDNLLAWSIGGNYDFRWRENRRTHPLSVISSGVSIQPPGPFRSDMSWATDVYRARPIRSYVLNMGLNLASGGARPGTVAELPVDRTNSPVPEFRDTWNLGLAYSYAGALPDAGGTWDDTQTANAVSRIQFSPAWGLEYSTNYDLSEGRLGIQRFSLTRDLHCWTATFTRTLLPGGASEYYFRIGIKEQREIFLERGTRVGSIGGIQ